ncbi:uncharacterized protein LOC121741235 [Salvia splendens]|uniref:uncharacterized protein LOC121741235 n=1 Tax=Salvia splendens TaxID=180675 RepID=UPI001C26CF09|nr:uncharacterized protein LOC121741235 [Salvia splendens]
MVHGILELMRDFGEQEFRWVVMGDDDTIFLVDNIVDVVAKLDHTKYFYLGGQSEFILSGHWFSFDEAFGGAGIIMSYPVAKALAEDMDMDNCLNRYAYLFSSDNTTKNCIADIGANLSPQLGNHQLHHLDVVEPIFPSKDRFESTRHLMTAAAADQSRMLQQIICHRRQSNWTISIAWGYSAQIYESIFPRSYLRMPLETWFKRSCGCPSKRGLSVPTYASLITGSTPGHPPCEAPHNFFFETVDKSDEVITTYARAWPPHLPPCFSHSADGINIIQVYSPATTRYQMDRCE